MRGYALIAVVLWIPMEKLAVNAERNFQKKQRQGGNGIYSLAYANYAEKKNCTEVKSIVLNVGQYEQIKVKNRGRKTGKDIIKCVPIYEREII